MRVISKAASWRAGGLPPVLTYAPPSVELVAYSKPDRMAVFVLNGTMNQLDKMVIIRYVVPLRDIEIRVRTQSPVGSVRAASGRKPVFESRDSWLSIRLAEVNEYEVLLVNLEGR